MATLQEGIVAGKGTRARQHLGLLFLTAADGAAAADVGQAVERLWEVYQGLKVGHVPDLPGHEVPHGELQVLLGFGASLFARPGAGRPVPPALATFDFAARPPWGGQPVVAGGGLHYADDLDTNPGRTDLVVQLTADTELAVARGAVETWKCLHDLGDTLALTSVATGFLRDDRRSWIDFHDGVSNLEKGDERLAAVTIKRSADAGWTAGGSYLAFMRVEVDLAPWRALPVPAQELLVGRSKLTGAPLVDVTGDGVPVPVAGCPVAGTSEVVQPGNEHFREPADVASPTLRQSHVQRANHHVGNPADASSLRVFRQGYEFFEPTPQPPFFRAGLNFVSFQDTPQRLQRMLSQPGWLGGTNFAGGPDSPQAAEERLLTVRGAGVYLAPPVEVEEAFPGAAVLGR